LKIYGGHFEIFHHFEKVFFDNVGQKAMTKRLEKIFIRRNRTQTDRFTAKKAAILDFSAILKNGQILTGG
jgi:hypothetical protein